MGKRGGAEREVYYLRCSGIFLARYSYFLRALSASRRDHSAAVM